MTPHYGIAQEPVQEILSHLPHLKVFVLHRQLESPTERRIGEDPFEILDDRFVFLECGYEPIDKEVGIWMDDSIWDFTEQATKVRREKRQTSFAVDVAQVVA